MSEKPEGFKPIITETKARKGRPSTAAFKKELVLNTEQSQHIMRRSFSYTAFSLFSIGVILRITAKSQEEVDAAQDAITETISETAAEISKGIEQMKALIDEQGIEGKPEYSNPSSFSIDVTSPETAQLASCVCALDDLITLIDTLWLNGSFTNKQRNEAVFGWRQSVIKACSKISSIENRARASAKRSGKEDEVNKVAPKQKEAKEAEAA